MTRSHAESNGRIHKWRESRCQTRSSHATVLPIPDVQRAGLITYDAKDPDTKFPPIRDLRPPKGAPNVLVILIDDVGYGATSVFGGPCQTPNFEKLAKGGLRYTRFHTTALCSPTRQALLTGRNHHSVGMGGITEIATAAPGYSSVLPNTKAPLALTLKLNGYVDRAVRQVPRGAGVADQSGGTVQRVADRRRRLRVLLRLHRRREQPVGPGAVRGHDADRAAEDAGRGLPPHRRPDRQGIAWTRQQKALLPDKPFFIYFAPGATHAPHHVPKDWIDKYKGKFAHGWDKQREITFNKQKELGVIARRRRADAAAQGNSGLGRHGSQAQAGARARDGSVRRVHGAHRPPCRPDARCAQGHGHARRHADLSRSSATTAPRPRARSRARSTRWPTSTAWPRSKRPSS